MYFWITVQQVHSYSHFIQFRVRYISQSLLTNEEITFNFGKNWEVRTRKKKVWYNEYMIMGFTLLWIIFPKRLWFFFMIQGSPGRRKWNCLRMGFDLRNLVGFINRIYGVWVLEVFYFRFPILIIKLNFINKYIFLFNTLKLMYLYENKMNFTEFCMKNNVCCYLQFLIQL